TSRRILRCSRRCACRPWTTVTITMCSATGHRLDQCGRPLDGTCALPPHPPLAASRQGRVERTGPVDRVEVLGPDRGRKTCGVEGRGHVVLLVVGPALWHDQCRHTGSGDVSHGVLP